MANDTTSRQALRSTASLCDAGLLKTAFRRLRIGLARRRQRRALSELSPWQLRDIGVTPEEARREAEKPFWR